MQKFGGIPEGMLKKFCNVFIPKWLQRFAIDFSRIQDYMYIASSHFFATIFFIIREELYPTNGSEIESRLI